MYNVFNAEMELTQPTNSVFFLQNCGSAHIPDL